MYAYMYIHVIVNNIYVQVEAWISEKISVATDESYKDPTNLKAKLQKHQAFEAEITANEERIQNLAKVTTLSYINSFHYSLLSTFKFCVHISMHTFYILTAIAVHFNMQILTCFESKILIT